jgi:hypothetical protein
MERSEPEKVKIGTSSEQLPYSGVLSPDRYPVTFNLIDEQGGSQAPELILDLTDLYNGFELILKPISDITRRSKPDVASSIRRPGQKIAIEWDYANGVPPYIDIDLMQGGNQVSNILSDGLGQALRRFEFDFPPINTDINDCYIRIIAKTQTGVGGMVIDSKDSVPHFDIMQLVVNYNLQLTQCPNGSRSVHTVGDRLKVEWKLSELPANKIINADFVEVYFGTNNNFNSALRVTPDNRPGTPESFLFPIPAAPSLTLPSNNCFIWVLAFFNGKEVARSVNSDGFVVNNSPVVGVPLKIEFTKLFKGKYTVGEDIDIEWRVEGQPTPDHFDIYFSDKDPGSWTEKVEIDKDASTPMLINPKYKAPNFPSTTCYIMIYAKKSGGIVATLHNSQPFEIVAPGPILPPPGAKSINLEIVQNPVQVYEENPFEIDFLVSDSTTSDGINCELILKCGAFTIPPISVTRGGPGAKASGKANISMGVKFTPSPIPYTVELRSIPTGYVDPNEKHGQIVVKHMPGPSGPLVNIIILIQQTIIIIKPPVSRSIFFGSSDSTGSFLADLLNTRIGFSREYNGPNKGKRKESELKLYFFILNQINQLYSELSKPVNQNEISTDLYIALQVKFEKLRGIKAELSGIEDYRELRKRFKTVIAWVLELSGENDRLTDLFVKQFGAKSLENYRRLNPDIILRDAKFLEFMIGRASAIDEAIKANTNSRQVVWSMVALQTWAENVKRHGLEMYNELKSMKSLLKKIEKELVKKATPDT